MLGTLRSTYHSLDFPNERRRGRRFTLPLNCRVRPFLPGSTDFAGTVINISRSGILVGFDSAEISGVLKPHDLVRIEIDLPRHPLFSPRCLECSATFIRSRVSKTQTQIAFEIGQMQVKDQGATDGSMPDWLSGPLQGLIQ